MLDDVEAARRRELHQRVYAAGGSLTDAEVVELHDLDNRHLADVAVPEVQTAESDPADAVPVPRADEDGMVVASTGSGGVRPAASDPAGAVPADAAEADARSGENSPAPAAPTRRWMLALVAAVAVLVGLGAGWLVFGAGTGRMTMTAAQQDTWSELEASGDYDPGSIQVVGAKYGATTWRATQQGSTQTCVILTWGDRDPSVGCRPTAGEHGGFDLQASLDYTEDGDHYMIFAVLAEDTDGDPVTVMQRQNMTDGGWDWRSQYSDEELVQVDLIEQTGVDGEWLTLLGYDGLSPIWLYQGDRTCLMVLVHDATEVAQQCGSLATEIPLQLAVGDAVYSVLDSPRGPSLTVFRAAVPTQVTCDAAAGDCASIDDTTGEID